MRTRRSGSSTAKWAGSPPIRSCRMRRGRAGRWVLGHFGYDNPNKQTVSSPPENVFLPFTANGQQPTSFLPGAHADVFQVGLQSGSLTWRLTGKQATATADSPRCQGSITIRQGAPPE